MAWIELKPEGAGPIRAWRADPSGKPRGGVVVIQEIFGVNPHIRAIAIDCCGQGFTVMAPSLFGRVDRELGLGHGPAEVVEGMRVATKLALDGALKDVQAAITYGRLVCGPKSDSAGTLFSGTPG